MALNPQYIGKRYPDMPAYLVGREKIREFATAIGDLSPVFHDLAAARAAGHPDLPAPPTFAFAITMKAMSVAMFDPQLGLDYSRVVHGEQSFTYRRPLVAGDEVIVRTRIADITTRGVNELLTTSSELFTVDGTDILTSTSVIVSRGTAA